MLKRTRRWCLLTVSILLATAAGAVTYEYDALGRVTRVAYDDGSKVEYQYDAAGNIQKRTAIPVPEPGAAFGLTALAAALGASRLRRWRRERTASRSRALRRRRATLAPLAVLFLGDAPAWSAGTDAGAGQSSEWLAAVRERIADDEYEVRWQPARLRKARDAWQAPNRAQRIRTHFLDDGIRVTPRENPQDSWEIGLSLLSYGRGERARSAPVGVPRAGGRVVRYDRGEITEWFVNDQRGLEHGFSLRSPPRRGPGPAAVRGLAKRRGSDAGRHRAVYVALAVEGDARPVLAPDRQSVEFVRPDSPLPIARYSHLLVKDARGRVLDSWMETFRDARGHGLRLVFDDRDARYPVEIDPLLTTPSWSVEGNQEQAGFGFSVAGAGDVNGDGFDDVLVGVPFFDDGAPDSGRAYLFLGSPGGLSEIPVWFAIGENDGFPRFRFANPQTQFGYTVASAGDVNADGFDDILVADLFKGGERGGGGQVLLYRGSPSGPGQISDWKLFGRIDGAGRSQMAGTSLAGAMDLNADGFDDIAIGEPGFDFRFRNGRVWIFYGEETGSLGGFGSCRVLENDEVPQCGGNLPTLPPTSLGASQQFADQFGDRVAAAGDVNCDGFDDLVVGQPEFGDGNDGRVTVFLGKASRLDTDQAPIFDRWGRNVPGFAGSFEFGRAVAGAGAIDRFRSPPPGNCATGVNAYPDDILVGAPGRWSGPAGNQEPRDVGAVYVIKGNSANPPNLVVQGPVFVGTRLREGLGATLARVGDVNGDGADDFLVGAPGLHDVIHTDGRAYLFLGPTGSNPLSGNVVWRTEGEAGDHLGGSVAGAGDVNGDGLADIAVGSSSSRVASINGSAPTAPTTPGAAFVFHGTLPASLASLLGLDPGTLSVAGIGSTQSFPNSTSSPAVSSGPSPDSILISTGLAQDEGRGATDWNNDGAPDKTIAALSLAVPPGMRTLRFTTQYLTSDPDQVPLDSAVLRYDYSPAPLTQDLPHFLTLDRRIEETGRGRTHAPISHGIDVTGEPRVRLQLTVTDETLQSAGDTALVLSRMFFSELPLPDYLNDVLPAGPDVNANGLVDNVINPRPSDISSAAGTFRHQIPLLNVPGKGLPFTFSIGYSSDRVREEQLGPKWSHSFALSAEEFPDFDSDGCPDSVFVYLGAGAIEAFEEEAGASTGSCTFQPQFPGVFSTLMTVPGGGYGHVTKRNVRSYFQVPGKDATTFLMNARRDPNGIEATQEIVLEYDPGTKLLTRVTDTRGEEYLFAYDTVADPPRLESLTGPGAQVRFAYGPLGFLESVTDANGLETTFSYDADGNLLTLTDADGLRVVQNEYEGFAGAGIRQTGDRVVRQRNANPGDLGRTTAYAGDSLDLRDRVNGAALDRYDVFGRRVESRVLLEAGLGELGSCDRGMVWCAVTEFQYNAQDQVVKQIDPRGVVTVLDYDDQGNLICRTEDAQDPDRSFPEPSVPNRMAMLYDARNNPIAQLVQRSAADLPTCPAPGALQVDPAEVGKWWVTSFTYDARDNLLSQTDPDARSIRYSYYPPTLRNGFPGLLLDTRIENRTRIFEYDSLGHLSRFVDPIVGSTRFTNDQLGRRVSTTDRRGFTSLELRDPGGRLISTTDALGHTESFTYDARGRQLTRTDAAGELWTRSYVPSGPVAEERNPLGHAIRYAYDAEDRLTSLFDPRGFETKRSYDAAGRLLSIVDPLDGEFSFAYDPAGNRTSRTDPRGNTTEFEYDGLGRRILERDPLGNETTVTYDTRGQELTRTDPNPLGPAVWTRSYTDAGVLASVTDPEGVETTFTYDRFSPPQIDLLTQVQLGLVTDHDYDVLGRLTSVAVSTAADGVLATAQAEYDAEGNNTAVIDPNGNRFEFAYDGLNRITLEREFPSPTEVNVVSTTFDARGLIDSRTNARGEQLGYRYDAAGRQILVRASDVTGSWEIGDTLDENGNSTTSTATSSDAARAAASVERAYDALDRQIVRTVDLSPTVQRTVRSEYDAASNLTAVIYSDGKRVEYDYDELNRLTTVREVGTARETRYEYDAVGNLVRVVRPDGSETVSSFDRANRLTSVHDRRLGSTLFRADFTLDAAGRRTGAALTLPLEPTLEETETYVYDGANRLVSRDGQPLQYDADGNLTSGPLGGAARTLAYNALNQLVEVDGEVIRYDADGLRASRTVGGVTTFYLYDTEGRLIEELDASGNIVARYVQGAGLISRESGGSVSVYHYDSRGSTVALTDLNGNLTDRYAYTPYGAVSGRTGTTPNPFTYAGREGVVDDGNGLLYMRARYYAPEIMRFVQKDPVYAGELGRPQSLNRYAYVEGNPVELVDPTGEFGFVGAALGALAGGVVGAAVAIAEGEDLEGVLTSAAAGAVTGALLGGTAGTAAFAGVAGGAALGGGLSIGLGFATGEGFSATDFFVGAASGAITGLGAVRGASTLLRLGSAVAGGAFGGLAQRGDLESRLQSGAVGAAFGGLLGAAGQKVGSTVGRGAGKRLASSRFGSKALDFAARRFVRKADRLAVKQFGPGSIPLNTYINQLRPGVVNASGFIRSGAKLTQDLQRSLGTQGLKLGVDFGFRLAGAL